MNAPIVLDLDRMIELLREGEKKLRREAEKRRDLPGCGRHARADLIAAIVGDMERIVAEERRTDGGQ